MRNRDLRPAAKANPTIQQAFERFQKYNRLKNLSQGSLDFYAAKGRSFFRFLGDTEQPIHTITEETVENYIFYMKDQQLHDTTINTNLRMVRAFLYWCIKNNSDTNYIICDGGIHHLKYHGQTMAMQIPEMEVLNTSAETKPYCICGSLCTVADVLVREVELPIVSRNDVILFHRCGAYSVTEGSALFLSRKMPEVYLYNEAVGLEKMRGFISTASINRNSICQG